MVALAPVLPLLLFLRIAPPSLSAAGGLGAPVAGADGEDAAPGGAPPDGALDNLPPRDPRPQAQVLSVGGRPAAAPALAAPSLLSFNVPRVQDDLRQRRRFHPVFTGIEERDGRPTEILALRVLLGDPEVAITSRRLRRAIAAAGGPGKASLAAEAARLSRWLEGETARPDFERRYLSYEGLGREDDPDFFIYTTPAAWLSRCYGEVVFEIREAVPRGVDLNTLNREVFRYYDRLSLADRLNPRATLIRHLFDRDEYVIPSLVPAGDIAAVEVRARLPIAGLSRSVQPGGRLQRRYVRGSAGASRWVDMRDRKGRGIARFTLDPAAPALDGPRSTSGSVPPEIERAVRELRIAGRAVISSR
jgi:hypothetical protein